MIVYFIGSHRIILNGLMLHTSVVFRLLQSKDLEYEALGLGIDLMVILETVFLFVFLCHFL